MRNISKLTCLTLITLGLSGCSATPDVLQGLYDGKAQEECGKQFNENSSIHSNVKSSCNGAQFDSQKNQNALGAGKKSDWKAQSEARKKNQINTYGN